MLKYFPHIITVGRNEILSHREFFYVGDKFSDLNYRENSDFLLNVQKALILSLEKRKLITAVQRKQCIAELERQNDRKE